MENKDLITEGNVYELLDEQPIVEIGVDTELTKVEDKDEFTQFKELYKGVIDLKCSQDYGTCEDKDLWDDIAKELFLKSKHYVPECDVEPTQELDDAKLEESKELSRQPCRLF